MSVAPKTQGERLVAIEGLLTRALEDLSTIQADLRELKIVQEADKADLAALKNRGLGMATILGAILIPLGALVDRLLAKVMS